MDTSRRSRTSIVRQPPRARASFIDLGNKRQPWVDAFADDGGLVFADLGWDPEDRWDIGRLRESLHGCYSFSPNSVEAMSYTRTESPEAALAVLSELVPLAVVTCGADGAIAHHQAKGENVRAPAVEVEALDPTGAGDVFLAGLMVGTVAGWPLEHGLRLANLGAALSVRHFGGALAAPGWARHRGLVERDGVEGPDPHRQLCVPRHDSPRRRCPPGLQGDRHPGLPFWTLNDVSEHDPTRAPGRATEAPAEDSPTGGLRGRGTQGKEMT